MQLLYYNLVHGQTYLLHKIEQFLYHHNMFFKKRFNGSTTYIILLLKFETSPKIKVYEALLQRKIREAS